MKTSGGIIELLAELRKTVKKNPGAVKRRSFLRKAGLVDFKLPVTIRLRNVCDPAQNPTGVTSPGGVLLTTENCNAQGTALNQRTRLRLEPALSFVPEARAPPKGCWPTTAPVGLSFT